MPKPTGPFYFVPPQGKITRTILSWFVLIIIPISALAEEEPVPEDTGSKRTELRIVVTTPSRLEEPVQDTSGSVSIITAPEMEVQNPITVPEVLRDLPGVRLQESGTLGESAVLSLRGAEPSQTLILLDGIRINSPFRGGFDLGNFMIDEIGQAEIVRGGQSALYGSEAIGGVVNLKTRRAIRPLEVSLTGEGGNESTFREILSVGGRKPAIDYSMTFSRTNANGQSERDLFRASSLAGLIGLPIRNSGRLQLISRFLEDQKELATNLIPVSSTTVQAIFDQNNEIDRRFLFNSLQYQDRVLPWLGLSWKAALVDTDLDWDNPIDPGSPTPDSYFEDTDTRTLILDFQQNIYADDSDTFTFGIEWKRDSVDSSIEIFGVPFAFSVDKSRRNIAYYFQNLFKWEDRFILQAGVRTDDNASFETVVNPKVSSAYEFKSTKTKLRASWGNGFRAPTIQEQFFPMLGNPELEPEKSRSWEAGLQQMLAGQTIIMDAAYYWIDYDNLIQKSPTGVSNIGKARTHGVESALEIRSLPALTVKANYTYLHAEDLITGQELPFRSRQRGNISLLFTPMINLALDLDLNLVSSQALSADFILLDGFRRTGRSPGYGRVDLSGTYYLFGNFLGFRETRFFIKIRNLFDRDYQDVPGFPAPGIGSTGGMTIIF